MPQTGPLVKTLTDSRGRRVRTSAVTHLLVRGVHRGAYTVSATNGATTVDLVTLPTKQAATERAVELAASTGLAVTETMPAPTRAATPLGPAGQLALPL